MRRNIQTSHWIRHPNQKRTTHYRHQSTQLSTSIRSNRQFSKSPQNHPLKFFTDFLPPHPEYSLPSNQHQLNLPLRHYFHLNRKNHHLTTPASPLEGTAINSETSLRARASWWQCSHEPIDRRHRTQQGLERSTVHPKLKLALDRNDSFRNYTDELFRLRSSSNSSTVPIPNSIKSLLKDSKFQHYFHQIWSDLNPHEENEKDDKFKIIELQRKSVQILLQTMIDASANLNQVQKIAIFNAVMHFLIANRNSERLISLLGLHPIMGWRNLVKEHLRIQTLKTLVSFINIFIPNLSTWWSSEISQAQDDPIQLHTLAQVGLFLVVALSKEGSVWKAFKLFWMMDSLPHTSGSIPDMLSHAQRAATALGLVDALSSRKRIDAANDVLETLAIGKWLGPLYQRYLLSMLMIKAARGELSEVMRIGNAYERAWASSNETEVVAGRNKRSRAFHLQDPRIPVARAKIEALGTLGETRSAIEIFQETMRTVPPKLGVSSQLPDLYAEIMKVYLKTDNPKAIERLLSRMISTPDPYGLNQPDQRHYNILLQAYANRIDIEGCSSVLDRLSTSGIRPDIYSFGNICLLFSNLGEPELIREVIQTLAENRSRSQSLKLNRELWNILLDAYIESGDWTRAAKLLKYLEINDLSRNESDAVTNGCVLKALVLSGSPTDKVLETFKSMYNSQTGSVADARSYTLLLLSICDSGMLDLAEAVFYNLKGDGQNRPRGLVKPNVYMYGIMISASLRLGKHELAQGYLREMQWSGIRPNLVIYSMLTAAYAASASSGTQITGRGEGAEEEEEEEERQEDGIRVAYEMADRFRRELLSNEMNGEVNRKPPTDRANWGERPLMRKKLLHRLLGPIIQSYAKSARPAKALEMFRELVSSLGFESGIVTSDGKPIDLDIFTMLMDGYRRAQDPVGVMEVWKETFRLATQENHSLDAGEKLMGKVRRLIKNDGLPTSERSDEDNNSQTAKLFTNEQRHRRRANKLCLPLSIYTDCLSRHGYHEEIAKTWHEVQAAGFGFDAGNWNELCAAMFRSGNHRMGWWIAERVFFGKEDDDLQDVVKTGLEGVDEQEEMGWAQLLDRTAGFRSGRTVLGLEGTRLSGAQKTESPMRPPNRTFIRKTRRFDDQPATRMSVSGLLNWLEDPYSVGSAQEVRDADSGTGWSQQLEQISQARRELGWRPSGKVLRMLHGSMWRECSDWVIGKWEELEGNKEQRGDQLRLESNLVDDKEFMKAPVQEIVDGYQQRYPHTMVQVMAINDPLNVPAGLSQDELTRWSKDDFIIRVIHRTVERIRE